MTQQNSHEKALIMRYLKIKLEMASSIFWFVLPSNLYLFVPLYCLIYKCEYLLSTFLFSLNVWFRPEESEESVSYSAMSDSSGPHGL